MSRPNLQRAEALAAFPNLTHAAAMLGVATSTISRRKDLVTEARGDRDRVLAPREVMRLAAIFRKRSLNDVAQDLIDFAAARSAEERRVVEAEVERFFEERGATGQDREAFLESARRLLPGALYQRVEESLAEGGERLPEEVTGYPPVPED